MRKRANNGYALLLLLTVMFVLCMLLTVATQAAFHVKAQNRLLSRSVQNKAIQLSIHQKPGDSAERR